MLMKKPQRKNLVSAKIFAEIYKVRHSDVGLYRFKKHPCIHKYGKNVFVDKECIEKSKEQYLDIQNQAMNNYFKIIEKYGEYSVCKLLSLIDGSNVMKWYTFVKQRLFSIAYQEKSIFIYLPPNKTYRFLLMTNYILSDDFDIEKYKDAFDKAINPIKEK